jgi:predicted ferric reductase
VREDIIVSSSIWSAVTWDVARAGGLVAYVLLTASVVLGLALSMRWQTPKWPRLITNDMHSYLTLLSFVFIGVHGLAVWIDPFTHFGWQDILIPFATSYRTAWVAAGIVGLYLMLAVWISTQLRPRIGYALWRRLHGLTLVVYLFSTVHGLGTGTDSKQAWALALYAGSVLLVGTLLIRRLLTPIGAQGHTHPRLAALAAAVVAGSLLWAVLGPAHAGWTTLAGSVPALVAQTTALAGR